MKIKSVTVLLTGLFLSAVAFMGCQQATTGATADYSGTATKYFDAHNGGYVGEAIVTTNADGVVTSAVMNEWQGPSGWAAYTGVNTSFVGGEAIRMKMVGKNSAATNLEIKDFTFFYYNVNSKGWVEFSPPSALGVYAAPSAATAAAAPNFDAKMSNPLYSQAYVVACNLDNATDLVNVTITDGTASVAPVVTVGAKASASVHYGHLNKANAASTYMPVSASSIGYKANVAALIAFFKSNPTANYAAAVATSGIVVTAPSATYTAATDTVWKVADAVTGATYQDFPHYAMELQNAYLFATSEKKTGDLRTLK